jgi:hypothetical protein
MGAREEIALVISGDSGGGERALQRIGHALDPLKSKLDQVSKAGKALAVVFGGLAAAGGKIIQSTARVAMRNEVLALSLYTVGRNAGYTRDELDVLVDGIKSLGITTSQSRLSLTRMIQSQLDLSKATDLARTAQDLAVIAAENSSETYGNLMQAATSLQPRLLKQYGIVSTLDQILGDLSNSTDITAKRQRFLDFVLAEGAKVAGVYEESMTSVGKKITSIPRLLEEAKVSFGKHFLPIIGLAVDVVSFLLKAFEALPEGVQRALAMMVLFGTGISVVVAAVGGLMVAWPAIQAGFTALAGLIGPVVAAIGAHLLPILIALAAIIGVVVVAIRGWRENWGGLRSAVEEAWSKIKPLLSGLIALVGGWSKVFKEQVGAIASVIKGTFEPMFARLAALVRSVNWSGLFTTLKDAVNVVGRLISSMLQTIQNLLAGKGLRSFMPLREAMISVLALIALTWKNYISKALTWGWNLIVQAANGIIRAAQSVLVSAMRVIGNIIGAFLAPGSPPKKGPLSKITEWGRGLINTYLQSFALADFSLLRESLSPIKDALENALSAGDIDEAGFVSLFGTVRDQVAGLIAEFRKTGEIGEEALGRIAESLGEGGEELTKYIRLQLQHRQALDKLRNVQAEVADAEAAGFIPAALKAKLKAAEGAAGAAKDELDWQREYLAMQQESVDLQMRLVNVLDRLGSAMEALTGGDEVGAGAGGGLAEGLAGLADLDLGGAAAGLGEVRAELGVMSEDFQRMREQVVAFLALPFGGKLSVIAQYLSDVTGVDFAGFWERVQDILAQIDQEGLLSVLQGWVEAGLDYVRENWPKWAKDIGAAVKRAVEKATRVLLAKADELATGLIEWFFTIISGLLDWITAEHGNWGIKFAYWMGQAMVRFLTLLTVSIPMRIAELVRWLGRVIAGLIDWLATEAPRIGLNLWQKFAAALQIWVDHMATSLPEWISELVAWGSELLSSFSQGLLDNAPVWLEKLTEVGKAIVLKLQGGIKEIWPWLIEWFKSKLAELADMFPWSEPKDRSSPLRNLAGAGRALAENFASGIDFAPMRRALVGELAKTQRVLAAGGVGGTTSISQQFGDLVFPNVRGGRDALGVRREIGRLSLEGRMGARTQWAPS